MIQAMMKCLLESLVFSNSSQDDGHFPKLLERSSPFVNLQKSFETVSLPLDGPSRGLDQPVPGERRVGKLFRTSTGNMESIQKSV